MVKEFSNALRNSARNDIATGNILRGYFGGNLGFFKRLVHRQSSRNKIFPKYLRNREE
ncbi:hypothetical protein CEXT_596931, partial [Caerostris extrusa]